MKVRIKNFQSIEDVSFEIPEGAFTCIVGPSNIGKSALRRALECLIYNKSEASYIRNGTKTCSVELTFDDGTNIKWYRDKKTAGYVINDDDFTKLAGSVPDILLDKGFKELVINKDKYQVQIASQFNNIFLLNQTGGKVTEVLSNLGNLNRIIKSNKACQTDLKSNKSRLNIRREDIVSSKEKLKSYKGLDEQRHLVDDLKDHLKEIKEIKNKYDSIQKLQLSLNKSLRIVKLLRPVNSVEVLNFELDPNQLVTLKKLLKKLTFSQKIIEIYNPVKKIPMIDFNLKEEYDKYFKIKSLLTKLEKAKLKISLYRNFNRDIPVLGDFNLSKFESLRVLHDRVLKSKNKIIELREKLAFSKNKLESLEKERDNLHKTLGVCPLCDKEF